MRSGLVHALAVATLAIATATHAMAQDGARVAKVIVAGDDAEVNVVRASVTEQLDRLGVRAETDRQSSVRPEDVVDAEAGDANMVARVWIDASAPSETILYVADRSGSRVLVRRFSRTGRTEIAREATLAALQTAVDALLRGALIGVSREEARAELGLPSPEPPSPVVSAQSPPEKAPERPPSKPPPSPAPHAAETVFGLGLAYEMGAYAGDAIEHGPLATVSLTRPFHQRVYGLSLTGQYRFPIEAEQAPVTLRLESGALRLNALVDLVRTGSIDIRGSLGGGVDVVRADPGLVDMVDAVLTPISRVDPIFRAAFIGRAPIRILSRTSLELGLALDLAPAVRPYAVARGAEQTTLLSPWSVRPLVMLGVAVP